MNRSHICYTDYRNYENTTIILPFYSSQMMSDTLASLVVQTVKWKYDKKNNVNIMGAYSALAVN